MCFSATASFTAGAVLLPLSLYYVKDTLSWNKSLIPLSLFPLIFAIQQIIEGLIWQSLESGMDARLPVYGFLFFSHLFWLFWVPFSARALENDERKKKLLFYCTLAGLAFGLSLTIPFYLYNNWFTVSIVNHSIYYETTLIYDAFISREFVYLIYTLIVIPPLLFSSFKMIKIFGLLIFLSIFATDYFFNYTFISVWCYFSAILSSYLFIMLHRSKTIALSKVANG